MIKDGVLTGYYGPFYYEIQYSLEPADEMAPGSLTLEIDSVYLAGDIAKVTNLKEYLADWILADIEKAAARII